MSCRRKTSTLLLSESSPRVRLQIRNEFPADAMEDLEAGRAVLVVLNAGRFAIVDRELRGRADGHIWIFDHGYASKVFRNGGRPRKVYLHRFIVDVPAGSDIDHKNSIGLDNRASNLRICNRSQNLANRGKSQSNTTGYKGVYYHRTNRKYVATMSVDNKSKYIGSFETPELASAAYARAVTERFGEFARIN